MYLDRNWVLSRKKDTSKGIMSKDVVMILTLDENKDNSLLWKVLLGTNIPIKLTTIPLGYLQLPV